VEGASSGAVSVSAAAWSGRVIRALLATKLKATAAVALGLAALAAVGFVVAAAGRPAADDRQQEPPAGALRSTPAAGPTAARGTPPSKDKDEPGERVDVRGRVVDHDGKPLAGAKLFAVHAAESHAISEPRATSGPDGGFRFTMSARNLRKSPSVEGTPYYRVAATLDGFGLAWAENAEIARGDELILRLVRDVPIRGRILDLQGKPVVGATVAVESIYAYPDEDLSSYIKALRNRGNPPMGARFWFGPPPGRPEVLTTDAEGRFRLDGVGRERAVQFKLEGPTIRHLTFKALTRAPEAIDGPLPDQGTNDFPLHPATFDHLAEPARLIRGIVRDKEDGKPVAGAWVWSHQTLARAQTDERGRYGLPGHPKAEQYFVIVEPPRDRPLFSATVQVPDTFGLVPLEVNVDLVRGIAVRGRVTDAETGRPVKGKVEYHLLYPNPNVRRLGESIGEPRSRAFIRDDGTYSVTVLPGPGVLAFAAQDGRWERYVPASLDRERLKELIPPEVPDFGRDQSPVLTIAAGGESMGPLGVDNYNHIALINPPEDARPWTYDVALRVGRTLEGRVVGPDGAPVSGAMVIGLSSHGNFSQVLETDRFTIKALDPRRSRTLHVRHEGKGLGINVTIRGDAEGPVTIRLARLGSAIGRVLDAEGEPRKDLVFRFHRPGFYSHSEPSVRTDREGRFRIDGLVPGQTYEARVDLLSIPIYPSIEVEPGQVKDLGDAKTKKPDEK
jgi:protocatechuate 3,4-dioxygenase beta subunit